MAEDSVVNENENDNDNENEKMSEQIITLLVSVLGCSAVSTPLGAWLGSLLAKQKYQAELDSLRAEVQSKLATVKSDELENVRKANDILVESIVAPLKKEISSLRRDVNMFRKAVEKIPSCAYADSCPVSSQLQKCDELASKGEDRHDRGTCDDT
ncbi:MAG: hypothetical protein IKQ68_10140 [Prevotella sp.]|nr:hypothetical protein [Prevotella sp.]